MTEKSKLLGLAKFTISADPRHSFHFGYDRTAHRYPPDYVNPPGWDVTLDASRGLPLLDDPSPGGLAGVGGSLTLEAVNLGGNQELTGAGGLAGAGIHPSGPIQPSEVESYQWTVEELGGLSFR